MKTVIFCDQQSTDFLARDLRGLVSAAVRSLSADGDVSVVTLKGDELAPCRGCFHCWVKTPGLCVMTNDAANAIAAQFVQANVVIVLSEVCYGGFSYDIKAFLDRMIPLLSPFFEVYENEMHHKLRYESFPVMAFIGYGDCTPGEQQTFRELADRNALNLRPPKHVVFTVKELSEMDKMISGLRELLSGEAKP